MSKYFEYSDDEILFHYTRDERPNPDGFIMHTHEYYEIYCFFSGKGTFRIEGTLYPLERGNILIMRPAETHAIELDGSAAYERLSIHFSKSILSAIDPNGELLKIFEDRPLGVLNLYKPSDFKTDACREIINNLMSQNSNQRLQIVSSLVALLNELRNADRTSPDAVFAGKIGTDKQIIDYINRHLSDNLSLDLLCKKFYISKPQLCRIFKASTGSGVWEYITVKRLMSAQEQIRAGVSPTLAAQNCGFNDYSVFFRAYKRRFNASPKQIRK